MVASPGEPRSAAKGAPAPSSHDARCARVFLKAARQIRRVSRRLDACDSFAVGLNAWSDAMRGDVQVIDYLNRALKHELTAVNQYWLHYRILDNWGYKDFAKTWRKESIEEMQHADQLVARILFLDGLPNMQSLDPLRIGQNVKEILECDLAAEMHARALYLEAAGHCEQVNDRVTRILFETLTSDEEEHIDFLEAQLTLVEQLGLQLYAQKHVGELEGD